MAKQKNNIIMRNTRGMVGGHAEKYYNIHRVGSNLSALISIAINRIK